MMVRSRRALSLRLCLWVSLWLGGLAGLPAQGAGEPPLQPDEMYNIYVVDLSGIEGRTDAVIRYIAHRWRRLLGTDAGAQNGWILVRGGRDPNSYIDHYPLSATDPDQFDKISKIVNREQGYSKQGWLGSLGVSKPNPGLNLAPNSIGGQIAEEVRRLRDRTAKELNSSKVQARRLVTLHLITDEIWFQQDGSGTPYELTGVKFPDACLAPPETKREDNLAAALAAFPADVRRALTAPLLTASATALVIVRTGDGRFSDATERAAAIALLGAPALTGRRALAMRDRLEECEGADREIRIAAAADEPCGSGTRFTETRMSNLCPAHGSAPSRQALIMDLMRTNAAPPALPGPGGPRPAPPSQDPVAPKLPPAPKPSPALKPSPASEPPPVRPQSTAPAPAPADPRPAAPAPPPAPAGPGPVASAPSPVSPSPVTPAPSPAVPSPVVPAPSSVVPDAAPAAPIKTAPNQVAPVPPIDLQSQPPAPADRFPPGADPGRTAPPAPRIVALANRMQAGEPGRGFPNARAAGVTVWMVGLADPGTRITVFDGRDAASRPAPGEYRLVARPSPEARCDAEGRLSFGITFEVSAAEPTSRGRWEVTLPDACRAAFTDTTFATVTIRR
jgi:hypothetical protein